MQFQPLELSDDFRYVLDRLEKTDASMFITGRAGTGKSTLLQLFRNTTKKKSAVLAPTGIAALNVRGQTIHSFFGFPPKLLGPNDIEKRRNRKLYKNLEVLIIDEISMVRADVLDAMHRFLVLNREDPRPFGGVQMVFFGDLFQLPPVIASREEKAFFSSYYESPYFFSAKIMEMEFDMQIHELHKIYRQEEMAFIRLLDSIRSHSFDYDDLEWLNSRYEPDFGIRENYITLCAINAVADRINLKKLRELNTETIEYKANITGEFHPRLFPTDHLLRLKIGAQVMFLKNDPQKRFVNGTIGHILDMEDDCIRLVIQKDDGTSKEVELDKFDWEIVRYAFNASEKKIESNVVGSFRQYPLRLAWAITIHKSQGKTFDKVIIDLGRGAFEYGQTYVALSRCRTLDGIVLIQPIRSSDILVDPRIIEFYDTQRRYLN